MAKYNSIQFNSILVLQMFTATYLLRAAFFPLRCPWGGGCAELGVGIAGEGAGGCGCDCDCDCAFGAALAGREGGAALGGRGGGGGIPLAPPILALIPLRSMLTLFFSVLPPLIPPPATPGDVVLARGGGGGILGDEPVPLLSFALFTQRFCSGS